MFPPYVYTIKSKYNPRDTGLVLVAGNPAPATAARSRGPAPASRGRPPATVTAVPPAPSGNAPNPTEEDPAPGIPTQLFLY